MTIEKALTKVLRHDELMDVRLHLPFDRRGFVLLAVLRTLIIFKDLTPERLRQIVMNDKKTRFSIEGREDGLAVRANNGHSFPVEPDLAAVIVPWAVHGTFYEAWRDIRTEGLKTMNRQFIHMAFHVNTDQYKKHREIDIYLDCRKMIRTGISVLECTNRVLYTDGVAGVLCPCYFLDAIDVQSKTSLHFNCSIH